MNSSKSSAILPVSLEPVRYGVGDFVTLTHASFQNVWNASRNHCRGVCAISSEFVEKLRPYIGKNAVVTHTFPPGYEMTIQFIDGQSFHAKDSWVQKANLLGTVRVHLEDGSSYPTSFNAACTDEEVKAYFVGKRFDRGVYPREKMVKCVSVEISR